MGDKENRGKVTKIKNRPQSDFRDRKSMRNYMLKLNILMQKYHEFNDELRMCFIGYWKICLSCKARTVMEDSGGSRLRPQNEYLDIAIT